MEDKKITIKAVTKKTVPEKYVKIKHSTLKQIYNILDALKEGDDDICITSMRKLYLQITKLCLKTGVIKCE